MSQQNVEVIQRSADVFNAGAAAIVLPALLVLARYSFPLSRGWL